MKSFRLVILASMVYSIPVFGQSLDPGGNPLPEESRNIPDSMSVTPSPASVRPSTVSGMISIGANALFSTHAPDFSGSGGGTIAGSLVFDMGKGLHLGFRQSLGIFAAPFGTLDGEPTLGERNSYNRNFFEWRELVLFATTTLLEVRFDNSWSLELSLGMGIFHPGPSVVPHPTGSVGLGFDIGAIGVARAILRLGCDFSYIWSGRLLATPGLSVGFRL